MVGCGGVLCKVIFVSNPTTVEVEAVLCFIVVGCDNIFTVPNNAKNPPLIKMVRECL